jgi:hypothetical protein
MSKLSFILQAVTARFHADELRKILSQDGCKRVLASVAFVRKDGVDAISTQLRKVAQVSTFYIGIRNDITSIQGVKLLIESGVRVFAVDTAARSTLFHPKLFLAAWKADAKLIIGSANLTFSGLHNNIEAGAILELDLAIKDEKDFLQNLFKTFDTMAVQFPDNVFQIKTVAEAEALFDQGRLQDENVVTAPATTASVRKGPRDPLKAMKLFHHRPPPRKRPSIKVNPKVPPIGAQPAVAFTKSEIGITHFFEETLGTKLKNIRQSWGTHDLNSNRVFLRIWEDQIVPDGNAQKAQIYWKPPTSKSTGFPERLGHIEAIKKGAQGIGIVCATLNPGAHEIRQIKYFYGNPLLLLGKISEDSNGIYAQIAGHISLDQLSAPTPENGFVLVWESEELTRRDLNIPEGVNSNATGSMFWKKGATEDIDQRHFFRDEVFKELEWKIDSNLPHYERAEADFEIVIKGLNYGRHKLKLSHNTNKNSVAYEQKNSMTSVHWGELKTVVGKTDLLDRFMSLYRKAGTPPLFLLEID